MNPRPSAGLRRQVTQRAGDRREYCLTSQADAIASHQIDHVISEKHRCPTTLDNLALSCILCNLRKGTDLSAIDPATSRVTPLFNPRTQKWSAHFRFDDVWIVGLTPAGRATVQLLELNAYQRVAERRELKKGGENAHHRLKGSTNALGPNAGATTTRGGQQCLVIDGYSAC
ncbi:MAG: HNH endonuclease [Planctomycetes bacterium]|nr:HNH endonuclease [Planctomycetota bacterium]